MVQVQVQVQSARCMVQVQVHGAGASRHAGCSAVFEMAKRYDELEAWQLANELKLGVYELIDSTPARNDFEFRDQLRDSASSAPANISEGFGYFRHKEFAQRVRTARAEELETHNHLRDGVDRHYWSAGQAQPLMRLAERASAAAGGLIRYLMTTDTPSFWE